MTCEELRLQLQEVMQQEIDLEAEISETESYMWRISDYAGLDDLYSEADLRRDELKSELKTVEIKRRKIIKAMEELGCSPVDQA
ncbi:MAG: hypothetical protein EBZ61_08435 [Micrococcales bacterium]|nr:hypothetical protein [Micrococcales bacterium]